MHELRSNEFFRELEVSIAAALQAGQILLAHFQQPLTVSWKAPGDPVTSADQEASAYLSRTFQAAFPEDSVLSEEEPLSGTPPQPRRWIVDPMDGTREFIDHRDEFAVMIGLAIGDTPVLGVIHQPVTGKLYYGVAGAGAFLREDCQETALHVSEERDPSRMTIATSRSHHTAGVDQICSRMGITRFLPSGSLGLKVGTICSGNAHLYIHLGPETSLWDTCAPNVILTEAGGRMTGCDGQPLHYDPSQPHHTWGVVASTGLIHDRIVEAINDVRAVTRR